ncbi:hypothetical protein [Ramlibacter humi]|uniref:Uncharacterized protein n=1 Tax=Ramlibacter humi TaxID=2530451 RepID=A0A4Z0BBU0_9BURK|nr:hypothetical protein [Ramlibacter humi]TFY96646.1 hypothetical protein EZ216_19855 [Ramlibacter humi]
MAANTALRKQLLEAMASAIQSRIPSAMVDPVTYDNRRGIHSLWIVLRSGIELALADCPDGADTRFVAMRASEGMPFKLPFEGAYEDGCGVTDSLTSQAVLELLDAYEALAELALTVS